MDYGHNIYADYITRRMICIYAYADAYSLLNLKIFKRNIITLAVDVNIVPLSLKNTKMFK